MCGILGMVSSKPFTTEEWSQVDAILERLLLASERRGRNAAGYAYLAGGRLVVEKAQGSAERFCSVEWKAQAQVRAQDRPTVFLGHTRAATKGSERERVNNHPLYSKVSGLAVVHNGIISNDDALFKQLAMPRDGQVDSEVILRLVEHFRKGQKVKHLTRAVIEAYGKMTGGAAVGVIDRANPHVLVLAADGNPIVLGLVEELHAIFFASTEDILMDGMAEPRYRYGYFKERDAVGVLVKKVKDQKLVAIAGQEGMFRIWDADCALARNGFWGREEGTHSDTEWQRKRDRRQSSGCVTTFDPDQVESSEAKLVEHLGQVAEGREADRKVLTMQEFRAKYPEKTGQQLSLFPACKVESCGISMAHRMHEPGKARCPRCECELGRTQDDKWYCVTEQCEQGRVE